MPKLEIGRDGFVQLVVRAPRCLVFLTLLATAFWALAIPAAEEAQPNTAAEVTYYDFGPFDFEPLPPERDPWTLLANSEILPQRVTCPSEVVVVMTNANNRQSHNLRWAFESSDLVAVAVVGGSRIGAGERGQTNIETELKIEKLIRGNLSGRTIVHRREETLPTRLGPGSEAPAMADTSPTPGTRVLVFLRSADELGQLGEAPVFESSRRDSGIRILESSALAAHVERLEALERLHRNRSSVGLDPRELAEWFVATVEEPATRGGVVEELSRAVEEFEELAMSRGLRDENAAAVLLELADERRTVGSELGEEELAFVGAALTEEHLLRLLDALSATDRFAFEDLQLFGLVRGWGEVQAMAWLVARLQAEPSEQSESFDFWLLLGLESYFDDSEDLKALFTEISERSHAMDELWPDDGLPANCERRTALQAELARELRARLVEALMREN